MNEQVTPGKETSEHRVTKTTSYLLYAMALLGLLEGTILPKVLDMSQEGTTTAVVAAIALSVVVCIGAVLNALGYNKGRAAIKVAALKQSLSAE